MKRCCRCKEMKRVEEFYKNRSRKDGLHNQCKVCQAATYKAYTAANRARTVIHVRTTPKRCIKCKELKRLDEFNKNRSRKDGLQAKCKACQAAYHAENREERAAHFAAWYAENRERRAAYNAAYLAENREQRAAYIAAYYRARSRTDPWFRICANLRRRQRKFYKGTLRSASMVRDIGCGREFFLRHIESQFTAGMTFENHGTVWHLDHIFPLARVDLDDPAQVRAAFNWRNLQPMSGPENIAKSDAVTPEAQRLFDELVQEFRNERIPTSQGKYTQGEALWHGTTSAGAA